MDSTEFQRLSLIQLKSVTFNKKVQIFEFENSPEEKAYRSDRVWIRHAMSSYFFELRINQTNEKLKHILNPVNRKIIFQQRFK